MKTQKASDSFVWVGFIASWFVTSPALTSQLHLGLISHVCFKTYHAKRSRSVKLTQRSSLKGKHTHAYIYLRKVCYTYVLNIFIYYIVYINTCKYLQNICCICVSLYVTLEHKTVISVNCLKLRCMHHLKAE